MNAKLLLDFIKDLNINNNRDWFNENKERYLACKTEFEQTTAALIGEIGKFDSEIRGVQPKDCIFRIYRDTRFSYDKTPYKDHFGAYIAAKGGRKSEHGGYYLHITPEGSFLSIGAWSPDPKLLKMLRQSIFENFDEFTEIIENKDFVKNFDKSWYNEESLKTVPREFPKDFAGAYFLKMKHFLVSRDFTAQDLQRADFVNFAASIAQAGYPLNKFLNYTVEEWEQR